MQRTRRGRFLGSLRRMGFGFRRTWKILQAHRLASSMVLKAGGAGGSRRAQKRQPSAVSAISAPSGFAFAFFLSQRLCISAVSNVFTMPQCCQCLISTSWASA